MQAALSVCYTLKGPPITQIPTHKHNAKMLQVFIIVLPSFSLLSLPPHIFLLTGKSQMESHFQWMRRNFCQQSRPEKKNTVAEPEVEVLLGIPKFVACHCHFCIRGGAFVRFIPSQTVNSKLAAQNRTSNMAAITTTTTTAAATR